jgi:hypothetical protein
MAGRAGRRSGAGGRCGGAGGVAGGRELPPDVGLQATAGVISWEPAACVGRSKRPQALPAHWEVGRRCGGASRAQALRGDGEAQVRDGLDFLMFLRLIVILERL